MAGVKEIANPPDLKDVFSGGLLNTAIDALVKLPMVLLPLIIIYGGVMYMLSAGNDESIAKAKSIIKWGIIGFIVYLLAFLLTQLVGQITGNQIDTRYFEIPQ